MGKHSQKNDVCPCSLFFIYFPGSYTAPTTEQIARYSSRAVSPWGLARNVTISSRRMTALPRGKSSSSCRRIEITRHSGGRWASRNGRSTLLDAK